MPLFHIYNNEAAVNEALAEFICNHIKDSLAEKEIFTFCLTGGNTPRKLYKLLAKAYADKIDWDRVRFFIGDERYVPYVEEQNNARMIYEDLLQHLPVKESNVHMMRTDIPIEDSAKSYADILHATFDNQPYSFDLLLLGMGEDGHTLSLFPGREENNEKTEWCMPIEYSDEKISRITLTSTIANNSAVTVFLVLGENKAKAVSQVIKGKYEPDLYPAQLITPLNHVLHWFLDKPAAEMLADPTV